MRAEYASSDVLAARDYKKKKRRKKKTLAWKEWSRWVFCIGKKHP